MEITDLRIGNWVRTALPNSEIMIPCLDAQVQEIGMFGDIEFNHKPTENTGFSMSVKHITGIELTKALLKKIGFKFLNGEFIYYSEIYGDGSILIEYFSDTGLYHYTGGEGCKHGRGFKYVHQLQNFYYVLNGTELPINLRST